MTESGPDLGVFELRALLRRDGTLQCATPVVVVSMRAQLRFASGFGRLASGPLAALYVPPEFRLHLEPGCSADGAHVLTLAWPREPRRQRDLLPARVPIDDAACAALCELSSYAPGVVAAARGDAPRAAIDWLLQAQERRRGRCHGHRHARSALRQWSDAVTAAEDALIALARRAAKPVLVLPEVLQDRPAVRRFQAVTGYGPHRYAQEYRARAVPVPS